MNKLMHPTLESQEIEDELLEIRYNPTVVLKSVKGFLLVVEVNQKRGIIVTDEYAPRLGPIEQKAVC